MRRVRRPSHDHDIPARTPALRHGRATVTRVPPPGGTIRRRHSAPPPATDNRAAGRMTLGTGPQSQRPKDHMPGPRSPGKITHGGCKVAADLVGRKPRHCRPELNDSGLPVLGRQAGRAADFELLSGQRALPRPTSIFPRGTSSSHCFGTLRRGNLAKAEMKGWEPAGVPRSVARGP